jgi:energy-coupling factor transporter ATP-binding protein EcfA2
MEPDLLLLDEPMAGMNLEEKEDMSRFIIDVNQEFGTTIALIEHDMGVVMDLSDRVVVLDYGKKIADGHAGGGSGQPGRDRRLSRCEPLTGGTKFSTIFSLIPSSKWYQTAGLSSCRCYLGRICRRDSVCAHCAGVCAYLQGLRCFQFCPGHHGGVRRV